MTCQVIKVQTNRNQAAESVTHWGKAHSLVQNCENAAYYREYDNSQRQHRGRCLHRENANANVDSYAFKEISAHSQPDYTEHKRAEGIVIQEEIYQRWDQQKRAC